MKKEKCDLSLKKKKKSYYYTCKPGQPFSMTAQSRVSFCFLALSLYKILNKKTPCIINRLHPSTFYQFRALALASLQAIRARVKCFFPFFPPARSLPFILSFISLCLSSLSPPASLVVGLGSVGS